MRTFSSALLDALSSPDTKPVWLLKLDLTSAATGESVALHLSDQPYTLWGAQWSPLVTDWGAIDRYFDADTANVKVSDMRIRLSNAPGLIASGAHGISWYFRAYDLAVSSATVYLWLDGAGLTPPSGSAQNDLITILEGRPEIGGEITLSVCNLDIVSDESAWNSAGKCRYGYVLQGRYTRNQWAQAPDSVIGDWKPVIFGQSVKCDGYLLKEPDQRGTVEGPDALFDPASGADHVLISFDSGEPYPAPADLYIGSWRFPAQSAPEEVSTTTWKYRFRDGGKYYLPTALRGARPLFTANPLVPWPVSQDSGDGPRATSEPARGIPYQFYHGVSDTGNSADSRNPGKYGASIGQVYIDGAAIDAPDILKDDDFGIVWLRKSGGQVKSATGNPQSIKLKWIGVDTATSTGDAWMRPAQLTAQYPNGYNAEMYPCILGDFYEPASGGGAPVSTALGLTNATSGYPVIGARIARVRFVLQYTGLEISTQGTFNLEISGVSYSFAASQLADGAGIVDDGWSISKDVRRSKFEIWENNLGYPPGLTSPKPREGGVYQLSRDVTTEAMAMIESQGGFRDSFRAWFTGAVWPVTISSMIVSGVWLEVEYDAVDAAARSPQLTAEINGGASRAGGILSQLIPADETGTGFDDPTLPTLQYHITTQQTVCSLVGKILDEASLSLAKNSATGKWSLTKKSLVTDRLNTPEPTGGIANISQSDILADDNGLPAVTRTRSSVDNVINEVTVIYLSDDKKTHTFTKRDQRSINIHGVRRLTARSSTFWVLSTKSGATTRNSGEVRVHGITTQEAADAYATEILNNNSDVTDFYSITFPLGKTIALEPDDILLASLDIDNISNIKMRVISVDIDPGSLRDGKIGTVTVNARRYAISQTGFGQTPFGNTPFGDGLIVEN